MSTYSGMTSEQLANEKKYLESVSAKGGGSASWASNQMKELEAAYAAASAPSTSSTLTYTPPATPASPYNADTGKVSYGGQDFGTKAQNSNIGQATMTEEYKKNLLNTDWSAEAMKAKTLAEFNNALQMRTAKMNYLGTGDGGTSNNDLWKQYAGGQNMSWVDENNGNQTLSGTLYDFQAWRGAQDGLTPEESWANYVKVTQDHFDNPQYNETGSDIPTPYNPLTDGWDKVNAYRTLVLSGVRNPTSQQVAQYLESGVGTSDASKEAYLALVKAGIETPTGEQVQAYKEGYRPQAAQSGGYAGVSGSGSGVSGGAASSSGDSGASASGSGNGISNYSDFLKQMAKTQSDQISGKIDNATAQAVLELLRAQEDAATGFQSQRNQTSIDAARAKDAQALYNKAQGNTGGIGSSQMDSIAAAELASRQSIAAEQQRLATDTARQISDLRANGEYDKADALLGISNQLMQNLYNEGIRVDEAQEAWERAQAELFGTYRGKDTLSKKLTEADLLGVYNGQPTMAAKQYADSIRLQQQELDANAGWRMLASGDASLSSDQLAAMGISAEQANAYASAVLATQAAKETEAKPTLTAAQAKAAVKDGILTDQVVEAYQYYYGTNPPGVSDNSNSASVTPPASDGKTPSVGYSNDGLTSDQIKELQRSINRYIEDPSQKIAVDGFWGPATKAAAGGVAAKEYWDNYKAVYGSTGGTTDRR